MGLTWLTLIKATGHQGSEASQEQPVQSVAQADVKYTSNDTSTVSDNGEIVFTRSRTGGVDYYLNGVLKLHDLRQLEVDVIGRNHKLCLEGTPPRRDWACSRNLAVPTGEGILSQALELFRSKVMKGSWRMADPEGDAGVFTGSVNVNTLEAEGEGRLQYDNGMVFVGWFSGGKMKEGAVYNDNKLPRGAVPNYEKRLTAEETMRNLIGQMKLTKPSRSPIHASINNVGPG